MTPLVVEAIYENGTLKLSQALPFKEHERVRVTVEPEVGLARATSGLLGWTGDAETVERIAHDPALTEPAATDPARASSPPADEPSDFPESEMLDIWLNVPPSPTAKTVTATRGEPILPGPFEIDESDLAPE